MNRCPPADALRDWVTERLGAAEAETIADHLNGCPSCQTALDRLTDEALADCLAAPPGGPARTGPPPSVPGFDVIREAGRGGHGVVYLARESALDRLVALKILKQGVYAHAGERQRFQAEARAIARLHHPNVVPIHGVGEHDGVSYYVMEWLDGGSLRHRLDGTPQNPRSAAELVLTLARAVAAIHAVGIVHRDLKPGNVLLAADGTPKVSDFGTAKLTEEDAAHTPTQAVLGTPSYMAPEQALGRSRQVGPAADTYALGAILYELLTGRPPFKGETPFETLTQVREQDPVPPRRFQPKVPRDLETICLKCLHKEPARRFARAAELTDDLQRFLQGRPIVARPIGPGEKVLRWGRHNPGTAGLVAALGLALLAGFAGMAALWAGAERERLRAEENLDIAGFALADMGQRQSTEILRERGTSPSLSPESVQPSLERYRAFEARARRVPQLRLPLSRVYHLMFDAYFQSGQYDQARDAARRELALCEELLAEDPHSADYRLRTAWVCDNLGRIPESDPHEVIALRRRAHQLYSSLVADQPDEWTTKRLFAFASYNLGLDLLNQANGPLQAIPYVHQAVELMNEVVRSSPEAGHYQYQVEFLMFLSRLHGLRGEDQEALKVADAAKTAAMKAASLYPKVRSVSETLVNSFLELARCQKTVNNVPRGLEYEEEARDQLRTLIERFGDENPSVQKWRSMLAMCYFNLGDTRRELKQNREARDTYLALRETCERLDASGYTGPVGNLRLRQVLAGCYLYLGLLEKRLGSAQKTLGLYEQARALAVELHRAYPAEPMHAHDLGEVLLFTANELVDRALNQSGLQQPVAAEESARLLDQAKNLVREALALEYEPAEAVLGSDDLAPLRSWSVFRELVKDAPELKKTISRD